MTKQTFHFEVVYIANNRDADPGVLCTDSRRTRRCFFVWRLVCVAASRSALRTSTSYVHCRKDVCTTHGWLLVYDASSAACVLASNGFHTLHRTLE
jgi:hypothetical protein